MSDEIILERITELVEKCDELRDVLIAVIDVHGDTCVVCERARLVLKDCKNVDSVG